MSDVTARVRRGEAVTASGIVSQARGLSGVSRRPAALAQENAVPFWCLMFYTFVLRLSPHTIFPSLEPLHLAGMAAGVAVGVYVLSRLLNRKPLTIATPEVYLVSWFALVAMISIPLSRSPSGSLEYFLGEFLRSVIIFFLIANLLDTMERLKLLMAFMVLSGVIYSTTVLYNFATGYTMVSHSEAGRPWGYPASMALNPVDLALTLNVIFSLTVGLYFAARGLRVKMLLLAVMGLVVAGIIVTFSRGGFLALAATLAVLLVRWVRARGPLALVSAVALGVAVVVVSIVLAPRGYGERLYSLVEWDLDRVGSIHQRSVEMQVAFTSMLENPLIGAGLGVESLVYVEKGLGEGWTTHSIFLMVGSELGLPGLLVYVLLFLQVLKGLRQTRRRLMPIPQAGEVVAIAFGLELAVWSYLVAAAFLPVPYDLSCYYLVGMAAAVRAIGARLTVSPSRTL